MGYLKIIKLLIDNGADVNVCDHENWRHLHLAMKWRKVEKLKFY
jgi:ankyrin repeat protein